jgi:hypothetical protein
MKSIVYAFIIVVVFSCASNKTYWKGSEKVYDTIITSEYNVSSNSFSSSIGFGTTTIKYGDTLHAEGTRQVLARPLKGVYYGLGIDYISDYSFSNIIPKATFTFVYPTDRKRDLWTTFVTYEGYYQNSFNALSIVPYIGIRYRYFTTQFGYRITNKIQSLSYLNSWNFRLQIFLSPALYKSMRN